MEGSKVLCGSDKIISDLHSNVGYFLELLFHMYVTRCTLSQYVGTLPWIILPCISYGVLTVTFS